MGSIQKRKIEKQNYKNLLSVSSDSKALKYDALSPEVLDATWSACGHYRLYEIFNECNTITEMLHKWPHYKDP